MSCPQTLNGLEILNLFNSFLIPEISHLVLEYLKQPTLTQSVSSHLCEAKPKEAKGLEEKSFANSLKNFNDLHSIIIPTDIVKQADLRNFDPRQLLKILKKWIVIFTQIEKNEPVTYTFLIQAEQWIAVICLGKLFLGDSSEASYFLQQVLTCADDLIKLSHQWLEKAYKAWEIFKIRENGAITSPSDALKQANFILKIWVAMAKSDQLISGIRPKDIVQFYAIIDLMKDCKNIPGFKDHLLSKNKGLISQLKSYSIFSDSNVTNLEQILLPIKQMTLS
jgi:hypothetical protein